MPEIRPHQELLGEIKRCNQFAFRHFFDLYKNKVFLFALKFVFDEDQAKDVVQLVFVKFWEKRNKIDIQEPVDAYLYVITKNLCLDCLRNTANSKKLTSKYVEIYHQKENHTENTIIYSELLHQAEEIVEQLPEKQKRVYQMAKWDKMSYDEIAAIMEISKNTVKTQLKLANAFVKKNMLKIYGKAISLGSVMILLLKDL